MTLTPEQQMERSQHVRGGLGRTYYTIESVEDRGDGYNVLTTESGGFGMPKLGITPEAGDLVTLYYVNGRYTPFRGMDLNGVPLYFKTDAEVESERQAEHERYAAKKRQAFEDGKAGLDAQYDALPNVFKQRIDRFRAGNPDFRVEYEAYEMFSCTEGVKFAEAARAAVDSHTNDAEVDAFYADAAKLRDAAYGASEASITEPENPYTRWLEWARALNSKAYDYDYTRQKALIGSDDGHSGNTFGMAMQLAWLYIEHPDFVAKAHGALVPLVGCKDYGCTHEEVS